MRRREWLWLVSRACLVSLGAGCRRARAPEGAKDQAASTSSASAGTPQPAPTADLDDPLGSLDEIPQVLRSAFSSQGHRPAPPVAGAEPPQSFEDFLAEGPRRPRPGRETIALLPIGDFPRGFVVEYERVHLVRSPELALLERFCEAWFGLEVEVLEPMSDEVLEALAARELEGRRQVDAAAVLDWITDHPALEHSSCVLALTLEDLFAEDAAWIFGYASVERRVGVHSMLRYDPGFENADARPEGFERTILARALRVLAHEVAHMFGLRHCVHFACLMNATAGLDDLDRLPLHLCPVCMRKLWTVCGFELLARWERLSSLCDDLGLEGEKAWFDGRVKLLMDG